MARQALTVVSPDTPSETPPKRESPDKRAHIRSIPAPSPVGNKEFGISTIQLESMVEDWLLDCEYRLQSPRTLEVRRMFLKNLLWFLRHRGATCCDTAQLKEFFLYLRHGHEDAGGRWGRKHLNKPVRPITVKDYWVCLSTFFKWLVSEEILAVSPMAKIIKPAVRAEDKPPLAPVQIKALLNAARHSQQPRRDEAIVLILLDTGIRASELIGIKVEDVDLHARQCTVLEPVFTDFDSGKVDHWKERV